MSSLPPNDADREYRLIEQLELRVASANTDTKFESVVQKFLAALILKVGSENVKSRNLAIKVCQHINQRLKLDQSIALPTQSLLKTFRESQNAFVSRFALIFIEQSLSRLPPAQKITVLPELLKSSVPAEQEVEVTQAKMWSIAFDFLLDVLRTWRVPDHATEDNDQLKSTFQLSSGQTETLSAMLTTFVSYDLKTKSAWKQLPTDFEPVFVKHAESRSLVIVAMSNFLFTSIFDDSQRFAAAVLLSTDPNSAANGIADVMFKQCHFDLEQNYTVNLLFELFDLGRPKLQVKVLSLLSKSRLSTNRASKILEIVEQQLFQNATGLEAAKLRAAVFQYLMWAVRISEDLSSVKEKLQLTLREYIELQGWPVMNQDSTAHSDLRAKAYESIGLLTAIKSPVQSTDPIDQLDMITWLFTSLRCDTTKDVRASIDESIGRIMNVTVLKSAGEVQRLKDLLLWNLRAREGDQDPTYFLATANSTRYLAVRFINKVLPFDDVDARYMDILALGSDDRREVSEEGTRGLDPAWHITNAKLTTHSSESDLAFPSFEKFVSRAFDASDSEQALQTQLRSLAASVAFGWNLLLYEAISSPRAAAFDASSDWGQKLDALVRNDPHERMRLRQHILHVKVGSLVTLIQNAILGLSLGSVISADIALNLISLVSDETLQELHPEALSLLRQGFESLAVQVQATRVFGIVVSRLPQAHVVLDEFISHCSQWRTAVGQAVVSVQAALLCTGFTATRILLRKATEISDETVARIWTLALTIAAESSDKSLQRVAYSVIGQMCLCVAPASTAFAATTDLTDRLLADAKKEDEVAVASLGRVLGALYDPASEKAASDLLERLYGLHEVRKAELHFALGESLATAALGFRSISTLTEFDVDASKPEWTYHPSLFHQILDRVLVDAKTTKPSLKKASAIWLLSLIQYCDDTGLLKSRLRDCQASFARLLNDRDEVVQETGSRGLSLVYEKGDKSLRDDLVRDLVQSFTGGGAKMSGTVDEDTQLFEAGALPTEGGQSVQTYKDIVNLATEMGDPSLVYRFMNLASNNAIWTSRAAFGRFGLGGVLADSSYLTENKKFYPKLFRYRFDPNPNVQRSMEEIWKALVKDPNKVIEDNFDLIMSDLLVSIVSGKEWRAREASCAAISDLVQGREVGKFEKYLDQIWSVAFKVLDDVKETVRVAAMKFCRTLTGMLIRNLEVGESTTNRARTMMQHAIPFLLQQIEGGSAQEVQQYAIITLLEIVKKSPVKSLRAFAPTILERLVLSLSSLEHESINYLHLNADKYGLTADKLDKMRVSSINTSPVSEAIDRCLESIFVAGGAEASAEGDPALATRDTPHRPDRLDAPITEAMQKLEACFKTAIGLPSKVGLSRIMITLVVRHHAGFRPYADRFLHLTRKNILDRNATISVSFSMAVGYLVRLASTKEVSATSDYAQRLYFDSQELAHRAVAGEIVQAISKASNDVFMNFASTFLPFAFVGRNDLDADVRDRFDPPWKDNVGGSRALNLYLAEIVHLLGEHITSSLWPIRQACCLAVADLISSMEVADQYSEVDARLLWSVVEEALNGKTWKGKEKVVSALPQFVARADPIWTETSRQIRAIALREAKRTNAAYRSHALAGLGSITSARPDLDLADDVLQVLTNAVEQAEEQTDAMEVDGDEEEKQASARYADATFAAAAGCLFQSIRCESSAGILDRALTLVRRLYAKSLADTDLAIYDGARRLVAAQTTERGPSSSRDSARDSSQPQRQQQRQQQPRPPPQQQQQQHAAFWHGLVLVVFDLDEGSRRYSTDRESLRRSRVQLAQALAASGALIQASCDVMVSTLQMCLQGERSRPLKTELDTAITTLRSHSQALHQTTR